MGGKVAVKYFIVWHDLVILTHKDLGGGGGYSMTPLHGETRILFTTWTLWVPILMELQHLFYDSDAFFTQLLVLT